MNTNIKKLLKKVIKNPRLSIFLKSLYFWVFHKNKYKGLKTYRFTDEKLKYTHIFEAINYARVAELPNVYFEFGCHSGRTFSAAARAISILEIDNCQLYAFDSFQGLPETEKSVDGYFETGTFYTPAQAFRKIVKNQSGLMLSDDHIIQGFYKDSLTEQLQKKLPKVGVVHIDVDLYASTVEILEFLRPLLVEGTVILFDDWYCFPPSKNMGEKRALLEFSEKNESFGFEPWKAYSTFGKSFFVTKVP